MKEFATAVARVESEVDQEEDVVEFGLAGRTLKARLPTTGQISVLLASKGLAGNLQAIHRLLQNTLLDDGYEYVSDLLSDGTIGLGVLFGGDENNEQGIIDYLVDEVVGRPTSSPTDSSASPKASGRRSTGRAPGKGSIRSSSPQTASPTSSSPGPSDN